MDGIHCSNSLHPLCFPACSKLIYILIAHGQARIQVFLGGARKPPLRLSVIFFFIFKPTDVNLPLPFKFHCRIQSTN